MDYEQQQGMSAHQNMLGIASTVPFEEIAKRKAERQAEEARSQAHNKLHSALSAVSNFGTTEDIAAAADAVARVAAKAMRRRG